MNTEGFEIGQCVEINYSGHNIKMVIDELFDYRGDKRAVCKWFNPISGKFEKDAFSLKALRECTPDK
jgi:hypothetical protein